VVLVAETVGVVLLAGAEVDDWEVEAVEAEVVCGRTIAGSARMNDQPDDSRHSR
jgi:hypothetical protein